MSTFELHEDRYLDPDPAIRRAARALYAELIGAAIEVESTVGKGTAFTIWLAPTDVELPPRA